MHRKATTITIRNMATSDPTTMATIATTTNTHTIRHTVAQRIFPATRKKM